MQHYLGYEKYECLGINKPPAEFKRPSDEVLFELKRLIEKEGVEIVSFK